jgi:predicted secreted acid phosphatase
VIAAVGLAFGSLTAVSAAAGHGGPPSIKQQAAKVRAEDAYTPKNGNTELNINVLEDQVEHYYGSASATFPVVGTVTVPSSSSNYARQMKQIVAGAEGYLAAAISHHHGAGKPAVVFDIDDTLLNTYDYEIAQQFGYTPASDAVWVNAGAFPAVFYMPQLVSFADTHGYAVFFITGRPQSQTNATIKNLTSAGYAAPRSGHLFLKPSTPPSYLHCATPSGCTTIEYKSGTRRHISSLGYSILADFGDQYSDLLGGDAGHQVKIPNPMYYIP